MLDVKSLCNCLVYSAMFHNVLISLYCFLTLLLFKLYNNCYRPTRTGCLSSKTVNMKYINCLCFKHISLEIVHILLHKYIAGRKQPYNVQSQEK